MTNLRSSLVVVLLNSLILGCQTTRDFRIQSIPNEPNDLHVIQVKSSHVYQRCLFFNAEAENNWRHQHLIYIFSNKNEVFEIVQPHDQDRETCYSQIKKVEKILQAESHVRFCIRDKLIKNPQASENLGMINQVEKIELGSATYESQTLDSVCNSKKCFSNNDLWVNTCPGFTKN